MGRRRIDEIPPRPFVVETRDGSRRGIETDPVVLVLQSGVAHGELGGWGGLAAGRDEAVRLPPHRRHIPGHEDEVPHLGSVELTAPVAVRGEGKRREGITDPHELPRHPFARLCIDQIESVPGSHDIPCRVVLIVARRTVNPLVLVRPQVRQPISIRNRV